MSTYKRHCCPKEKNLQQYCITAAEDKRIECSRMMRKSMSFSSNATDAKVKPLASNFSLVEDLKK